MKVATLGNVNAYITTPVTFKGKRLSYDGTTKNLTQVLVANGAKAGSKFVDDQGRTRKVVAAAHDNRAGGFWVTSWNEAH